MCGDNLEVSIDIQTICTGVSADLCGKQGFMLLTRKMLERVRGVYFVN